MSSGMMDLHALAAAYVLDALPEEEQQRFEAHLGVCETCRQDVDAFRPVAAHLAGAVAEPPPPSLRERVMADIDVTRQEPAPLRRSVREHPRPRLHGVVFASAAAFVILVFGLTALVGRLNTRIDELQAQSAEAYAVLASEEVRTVTLTGPDQARARLVVSNEGKALLVADGLEPLDSDEVYELWLIDAGGPRPAGLFRPGDRGQVIEVLEVAGSLTGVEVVAITVEPRGGSLLPTSEPILIGNA